MSPAALDAPVGTGSIIAGKYRVERVLGQGGMGVVVAARHLQLGERVAIKFPIARVMARRDAVARLLREGRAAMRIRGEHVARVFDVGALETGEPYLVMEYLEGQDLGAVLAKEGPLPIDAAVECILHAAEALAEAHALGIIHRDLKPSNLFLTQRPDGSPSIKVIDFGVSKHVGPASPEDEHQTGTSAMVGSPLYMGPEQMRGARDVDARTDVWALGATMYALLTGAPPFPAPSVVEIHELIVLGAPRLRSARPDAPVELEEVVARCLQRLPADRYADMAELVEGLDRCAPERARAPALRVAAIVAANPATSAATHDDAAVTTGPGPTTAPSAAPSWGDPKRTESPTRTDASALVTSQLQPWPSTGSGGGGPGSMQQGRGPRGAWRVAAAAVGGGGAVALAMGLLQARNAAAPSAAAPSRETVHVKAGIAGVESRCPGLPEEHCEYASGLYPAAAVFDGDPATFWATVYGVTDSTLTVALNAPSPVSGAVMLERGPLPKRSSPDGGDESLRYDQTEFRIRGWELWLGAGSRQWRAASGESIGVRREVRFERQQGIERAWLKLVSTDAPSVYEVELLP